MATRYEQVMKIRAWINDKGVAKWGNGKWKPFRDGAEADITLSPRKQYSVRVFENDDKSIDVNISEVIEYTGDDSLSNDISQPGMKRVADTSAARQAASLSSPLSLDDDVPF